MNNLVDKYMEAEYKNINGKEQMDLRYVDNLLGKRYEINNLTPKDITNLFEQNPSKNNVEQNLLKLNKKNKRKSKRNIKSIRKRIKKSSNKPKSVSTANRRKKSKRRPSSSRSSRSSSRTSRKKSRVSRVNRKRN